MLAASVSGEIFASPSAKQICDAIALTKSPSVLVVINNYTGDRLNFGLAIEKARSQGILVESVIVADDVSLPEARGLAGNILVCKILGAMAERGVDLHSLKKLGDAVVKNLKSVGVGLDHCHVPGREEPTLMGKTECEIGLGLHNERGVSRETMQAPEELVKKMLQMLQDSQADVSSFIEKGDQLVLFVNNLGGMSQLEMNATLNDCVAQLGTMSIFLHLNYR
jgi:triose/dihydroxyacetone kinase / FAD-AMP lyase (cyclizing)